jgi:hypothetical protein
MTRGVLRVPLDLSDEAFLAGEGVDVDDADAVAAALAVKTQVDAAAAAVVARVQKVSTILFDATVVAAVRASAT